MQEVANVCPNIADLDLSRNLLERWEDVVGICTQLKRLNSLRLQWVEEPQSINISLCLLKLRWRSSSGNRFMNLAIEQGGLEPDLKSTFNGMKELGLDETFLSWQEVGRSMGSSASSRSTHPP